MHDNKGGQTCRSTCTRQPTPPSLGRPRCFGEYDIVIIADVPNNGSVSAVALGIAAGGAIKASRTTEGVAALKEADAVAKTYKPAR
jgi:hypothetical protein